MREIIFRGKRTDSSEWVEGFLWCEWYAMRQRNDYHIYTFNKTDDGEIFLTGDYKVDPETVGQYTERKDKTGIRIFEGDIVKIDSFIYQVEFRYSEWEFRILSKKVYCFPNFDSHTGECEIIGNIHDNPELLEVE